MTTFQSRELIRDEIAALFTANGSWQEVYNHFPSVDEIAGKTPVCIVRSRGTNQEFAGAFVNPVSHRVLISTMVLAYDEAASWTSALAEDKLDELDKTTRQIIRDNAGSLTNADLMYFEGGYSQVDDVVIQGLPYMIETRAVLVDLKNGAV